MFCYLCYIDFGVKILLRNVYKLGNCHTKIEISRLCLKSERSSDIQLIFLHGNMRWSRRPAVPFGKDMCSLRPFPSLPGTLQQACFIHFMTCLSPIGCRVCYPGVKSTTTPRKLACNLNALYSANQEAHITKSSIRHLRIFVSCNYNCVVWQKTKGLGFELRYFGFEPQLCQVLVYDLKTFLKSLNLSTDNISASLIVIRSK